MNIHEYISNYKPARASRQENTGTLQIDNGDSTIFIHIKGASADEIDAVADAINVPIDRMRNEEASQHRDAAE